ncbi:hypothetical protein B0H14DRAFT_1629522 [Mycena olivaceomarginata]|nr:hypothetical protein B0H14DRAFT_1629522 [Mycena olivaceomarginata]
MLVPRIKGYTRSGWKRRARLSGELSVSESSSTGTLSGLPLLNEQESADFSALSQSCNPVTTSPGGDHIPMFAGTTGYHRAERKHSSGETSLSGSLSAGSLLGPPILDEQRPNDSPVSRNLATTSPGRADDIPIASLYDDPSLSASFSTGTFSALPICNQDGSNHFSALIQSQSPGSDLVATSAQRGEDFIFKAPCAVNPLSSGTEPSRFPNVTPKPDASRRRKAVNRDTPSRYASPLFCFCFRPFNYTVEAAA